jgi:DNA-binding NtrC family response regulator
VERVLVVYDDAALRSTLRRILEKEGYAVSDAADGVAAGEVFAAEGPDAVLLDLKMPRQGGLETLRVIRGRAPEVPVIILTGNADFPSAVEAVKAGACDYLTKSPLEIDRVLLSLRQALERSRLERDVRRVSAELRTSLAATFGPSGAIGEVIDRIRQVAATDLTVVVQGETGTGKTWVAQTIHQIGARSRRPFVRVDVSVFPETLIESELFGARRGGYTGAERDRHGYFAQADGGTLFLDDIENIPSPVQAKLLDVIETGRVFPVGGGEPLALDLRVVAATNRDLRACADAGAFRRDLLYRLEEMVITVPPLRERPEDVRHFLDRFQIGRAHV